MDFEMRVQALDDEVCIVELIGEIDVYSSRAARQELRRLAEGRHSRFIVDLSRLTFIDSSGLGMLVRFLRRVREKAGTLVLTGATPPIHKLFRMTGLDAVFPMARDKREGVERLGQPGGHDENTLLTGPHRL